MMMSHAGWFFWGGRQSIGRGDCDEQIQDLQVGRRIIISPTININVLIFYYWNVNKMCYQCNRFSMLEP
jgi:hypothetical protein